MPDEFDWVQTTSGEWLKGEIVEMYDEKLAFDTDEFGLQIIDWEGVKELRSAQPMEVSFEGGPTATFDRWRRLLVSGWVLECFEGT